MSQINVYLTFNGNCAQAMNFYKESLGGELTMQTVAQSPMASQWPAAMQNGILHATLINGNLMLLASDMAQEELMEGNTVTLSLTCDTEEELNTYYANMSEGGIATRPPHDFFAGKIGALTDKFGKNWIFYYNKNSVN